MSVAHHTVIGPPGTGKTQYVARQAARAQEIYGSGSVLIASLTRTAATEIRERTQQVSTLDFPERAANTLHSHALRAWQLRDMISQEDTGKGARLAETPEGVKAWNAQVTDPTWALQGAPSDPDEAPVEVSDVNRGRMLLQLLNRLRARRLHADAWPELAEAETHGEISPAEFVNFAEQWSAWKAESGRPDFTDLIEGALTLELPPPGSFAVMFADEAQDSSRLEVDLLRAWGEHVEQVATVGDPLQALYEWRGADPNAMDPPDAASRIVLERSHRVPRAVLDYAVGWARDGGLEPPAYEPRQENGAEIAGEVELTDIGLGDVEPLLGAVRADLREGRTVMVLTTCSYMLDPIVAQLRADGMAFWNPYRVKAGHWNPLRGAEKLRSFLRPSRAVWGEDARLWTGAEAARWIEPLSARKAPLRERGSKGARIKELKAYDARVLRAEQLFPLFAEETADERAFDLDAEWWHERLLADAQRRNVYSMEVWRRDPAALSARPRLIVGTIHSVKGGQADTVYVFPDLASAAWREWENGSAAIHRQFYVAFTRARERLVLCGAFRRWGVEFPSV